MTRCRYQGVVTLGLLIAFVPVAADAQRWPVPFRTLRRLLAFPSSPPPSI